MLHAGGRRDSPSAWAATAPLGWSRTPGSPQDSHQPPCGVCGETQEPCIKQRREAMCQPGESLGGPRATAEGAPGGVSTCSQLTRASHPNSLLGAATRLALCYTQTSSPLTVPIWEHHPARAPPAWDPSVCTIIVPQGFTAPPRQWVPQPSSTITNTR